MSRTFDPWKGVNYDDGVGGVRVMLLGESHYGHSHDAAPTFTHGVVERYTTGKRLAFFTRIAALFINEAKGCYLDDAQRRGFYDRVAFCNYIQELLPRNRMPPTEEQWRSAREPLLETVAELRPDIVVILGRRLAGRVETVLAEHHVRYCTLPHPSSSHVRHVQHRAKLMTALEAARGT